MSLVPAAVCIPIATNEGSVGRTVCNTLKLSNGACWGLKQKPSGQKPMMKRNREGERGRRDTGDSRGP